VPHAAATNAIFLNRDEFPVRQLSDHITKETTEPAATCSFQKIIESPVKMPSITSPSDTSMNKFHFSLNVSQLDRAVEFYRVLFGMPPAKHLDDYAKFELADPALVMSLLPNSQLRGGTLSHLGLRLPTSEALVIVQKRLEEAGIRTQREEGVECCYAQQTKFWISDPDLNLWEMYTIHGDIDHHGHAVIPQASAQPKVVETLQNVWEHRMRTSVLDRIPHPDESLDEVRLEGTFGELHETTAMKAFLAEVQRVLRPGGRIRAHNLVASHCFVNGMPILPGPASVVRYVPLEGEVARLFHEAGFEAACFDKLGEQPCFKIDGVELREMRLSAIKPFNDTRKQRRVVVYKGPFSQVVDDTGKTFPCGEPVEISDAEWRSLQLAAPDAFVARTV
jgi:catechol 2,3-dioxygenase-like lactoylglutathione lyase family enzyme